MCLAPIVIQRLQQDRFLGVAHDLGAEIRGTLRGACFDRFLNAFAHSFIGDAFFLGPIDDRQI